MSALGDTLALTRTLPSDSLASDQPGPDAEPSWVSRFSGAAIDSFKYTFVQAPVTGVAQLGDYAVNRVAPKQDTTGTTTVDAAASTNPVHSERYRPMEHATTFFQQHTAQPGTPEYYGNLTGGVLAGVVGVGVLYRFLGPGAAAEFETSFRYGLSLTPTINRLNRMTVEMGERIGAYNLADLELFQRRVAPYTWAETPVPYLSKSMATGAFVGGVLDPTSDDAPDLVSDRLSKALWTGLTFTTATTVGIGLKQAGRGWVREALAAGTSGLVAGEVNSDLRTILTTGKVDTWENRIQADLSYGLGGAFGGVLNQVHEIVRPTNGVPAYLHARTYADAERLADTTKIENPPKPGQYDHLAERPPTAEELVELKHQMDLTHPDMWYERALLEPRLAMDYSGLDLATKKNIIGELQDNLRVAKMMKNEPPGQKVMTIYGSASLADDFSLEITRYIAGTAAHKGYVVQTGGGERGQMLYGNRGAYEAGGRSRAVTIKIPYEHFQHPNNYATEMYQHRNMGTRNRQLFSNDVAVVRKGGIGSAYELFGEDTHSQTGKKVDGRGQRTDAPIYIEMPEYFHARELVKQMVREGTASTSDLRRLVPFRDPDSIFKDLERREAERLNGPRPTLWSRVTGRVNVKPVAADTAKSTPTPELPTEPVEPTENH